ncbi:FadR/GntR family transcriptional regulator [Acidipropionibacterium virtanenii]|uniref:L-lactate dehydrogenase operon regulatory protein n=1 Tax=Acidipropionibacterium virtanenii TaxID=2057246 RepID=A0A344UXD0_9ACTN|nr:FCD domain-containing protein [Acidipropionibacterium virtanenii]AXE39928.1 Putative L-lactate dehydrogenase operon regulatory protein [Acidipropionibacterium virtanenii]
MTARGDGRDDDVLNRATDIEEGIGAEPEAAGEDVRTYRGFDVALSFIDSQILTGVYANGTRLPAERDLATRLGVSRGAVREAIRVLQAQGILVSGTGRGNGTRVQARPSNAIGRILRLQLALDVVSFADLTETRVALERAACAAAARRREPRPLAEAAKLLEQMRSVENPDLFNELDTAFHVALAEAGDNILMSDLTVAIRKSVETPISVAEHTLTSWPALREMLVTQHGQMLEAISDGDADRAAQVSEEHIRVAYQKLLYGMD